MSFEVRSKNPLTQPPLPFAEAYEWENKKIIAITTVACIAIGAAALVFSPWGHLRSWIPNGWKGQLLQTAVMYKVVPFLFDRFNRNIEQFSLNNKLALRGRVIDLILQNPKKLPNRNDFTIHPDVTNEEADALLARYQYWHQYSYDKYTKALKKLRKDVEKSELAEIEVNGKTPQQLASERYKIRAKGNQILEAKALPAMLRCALILEILKSANYSLSSITCMGDLHQMPFIYRVSDEFFEEENYGIYLTLRNSSTVIKTQDIINDFIDQNNPKALRIRIFGL